MLHADLLKRIPGLSKEDIESFEASRGWFEKLKRRSAIHGVVRNKEASPPDREAAKKSSKNPRVHRKRGICARTSF